MERQDVKYARKPWRHPNPPWYISSTIEPPGTSALAEKLMQTKLSCWNTKLTVLQSGNFAKRVTPTYAHASVIWNTLVSRTQEITVVKLLAPRNASLSRVQSTLTLLPLTLKLTVRIINPNLPSLVYHHIHMRK